jgi:hypothetical protein
MSKAEIDCLRERQIAGNVSLAQLAAASVHGQQCQVRAKSRYSPGQAVIWNRVPRMVKLEWSAAKQVAKEAMTACAVVTELFMRSRDRDNLKMRGERYWSIGFRPKDPVRWVVPVGLFPLRSPPGRQTGSRDDWQQSIPASARPNDRRDGACSLGLGGRSERARRNQNPSIHFAGFVGLPAVAAISQSRSNRLPLTGMSR